MKKLKKFHLRAVKNKLSEKELRSIVGGYDGSGTYDDPYQLPEVVVTCGKEHGKFITILR